MGPKEKSIKTSNDSYSSRVYVARESSEGARVPPPVKVQSARDEDFHDVLT